MKGHHGIRLREKWVDSGGMDQFRPNSGISSIALFSLNCRENFVPIYIFYEYMSVTHVIQQEIDSLTALICKYKS